MISAVPSAPASAVLDLVKVPADVFSLFVASGAITERFGALTSTMYMVTLALGGSYALAGRLHVSPARILRYLLVIAILTLVTLAAAGAVLHTLGTGTYKKDRLVAAMSFLRAPTVHASVLPRLPTEPLPPPREGTSVLDAIRARTGLRGRTGFVLHVASSSLWCRRASPPGAVDEGRGIGIYLVDDHVPAAWGWEEDVPACTHGTVRDRRYL
jgi:hypothetical protein